MSDYFLMPKGYRCPLCPNHDDDDFCRHPLLSSPICRACSHELINLVDDVNRIEDSALDQLELVTGLSYEELQIAVISPDIGYMEKSLEPEALARLYATKGKIAAEELIAERKQNLARFRRLVAIAESRLRVGSRSETPPSETPPKISHLEKLQNQSP